MCGGTMHLKRTQRVTRVLGNPKAPTTAAAEWICPDCDYFEEADEETM
jgi:hypothetical protein